jgi:Gametolysin peptidase M11
VVVPSAGAATLRALVIRATWGPELQPAGKVEAAFREADTFFRRSSFGAFGIEADVTEPIPGFVIPSACFAGGTEPGLGAVAGAAKAAAAARGYDLAAYDRFVYVFPEPVCGSGGLGVVRDVLLAGSGAVSSLAIVHELGHTLGLPHASGSACAPSTSRCRMLEYGDIYSPMGSGGIDFSAREKAQLGWIAGPTRASVPSRIRVGSPQEPGDLPKAVVARVAAGELWIEDVHMPQPTLVVRIIRATDMRAGPFAHTIYLTSGASTVAVPGVLRVRRAHAELALEWTDRTRPTRPRLLAVPRATPRAPFELVWRGSGDAGSGVARYRVRVDGRLVATAELTVATVPGLRRGRHILTLAAVDRAGNISRVARRRIVVR